MHPKEAARVERELRKVSATLTKGYHDMKAGPEKEEVGNTIHDINGTISKFSHKNYHIPWSKLEKLYYPNKTK